MAAPVVRNHAVTALAEKQHLRVPRVRVERPAVREHHDRAFAPILVIDLRAVLHGNAVGELGFLVRRCRVGVSRRLGRFGVAASDRRTDTEAAAAAPAPAMMAFLRREFEGAEGGLLEVT